MLELTNMTEANLEVNSNQESPATKEQIQTSWNDYLSRNETPEAVVIEITNYCPNNCAHCYANLSIGKNSANMSSETFDNWLEVLSSSSEKPKQIWLVGGEPTNHPKLKEFLQKTNDTGFQPVIVTTGESFSDKEYCKEIVSSAYETAVTIRGYKSFHDVMMFQAKNELLLSIPKELSSSRKQIKYVLNETEQNPNASEHFDTTIQGLLNIAEIKKETGSNVRISLNVDVQAMTDLYQIIKLLNLKNIPVESLILQIQTFSENNQYLAEIIPNLWRKPTASMVETYYKQAKFLRESGMFTGEIAIIDELSPEVLDGLKFRKIDLGTLYNPATTPAISPTGHLRPNVIKETLYN
jgi:organic radical activating enzyme